MLKSAVITTTRSMILFTCEEISRTSTYRKENIIYESDYSLKNSVKALLIFQVEGIPVLILQCVGTLLVYRGERFQELQYQNDN